MKLRQYGFFKELPYGDPEGASISRLRGTSGYDNFTKQRIVNYLSGGAVLVGCPGVARDVFSGEQIPVSCCNILTDGEWAWPEDLAYYVSKHDVPIPAEMVEAMNKNKWRIIPVSNVQTLELYFL